MANPCTPFRLKSSAPVLISLIVALLAGCGGSNDTPTPAVQPGTGQAPVQPELTLVAGNTGGAGSTDGVAASARFNAPADIAIGNDGTMYIADTGNNAIRKMAAGSVTTLAGIAGLGGHADGTGTAARFNQPRSIAVDTLNNIFVADAGNRVIRKISASGDVTTFAGAVGIEGNADGQGTAANFRTPVALANDSAGNLYVIDRQPGGVQRTGTLRKISPAGNVTTIATNDSTFSVLGDGVAVDSAGNLYVIGVVGSDTVTRTLQPGPGGPAPFTITVRTPKLLQISPQGEVVTLGAVQVDGEYGGIILDPSGNVYFSNYAYHTIYQYSTDTRGISVFAGSYGPVVYDSHGLPSYPISLGSADGMGAEAQFHTPMGLAAGSDGYLYIADQRNHAIRKASAQGMVTTVAGAAIKQGADDGSALEATFGAGLKGSAVDAAGNIYVADTYLHIIRKITPEGRVLTLAGRAGENGYADGAGAAARFTSPTGVTIDPSGNVYVADSLNSIIRKITPDGQVTTIAGTARMRGQSDGMGTSAQFQSPTGITRDAAGNLYVTDAQAGTIRKITPAGMVSTIAGSIDRNGVDSDGIGAAARFNQPNAIAVDAAGNLYVTDLWSYTIRKISPTGQVITLAGKQAADGFVDGTGSAARFIYPTGIALDPAGNLYVSDSGNSAIRKITPEGMVSTVIVVPTPYQSLPEDRLQSIAFSGTNSLYVTRAGGVFKLTMAGTR